MKWKVTFKTPAFTETLLDSTSFMFFKGQHQKLLYTHSKPKYNNRVCVLQLSH